MEQDKIIKALECLLSTDDREFCEAKGCPFADCDSCVEDVLIASLSLIKELTEENERLSGKVAEYEEERKYHFEMSRKRIAEAKADTVRKMQERLNKHFCHDPAFLGVEQRMIMDVIDQIAEEMLEGIE